MLVITGIFENERFIPDKPISIPQKKRVLVTIEEKSNKTESEMTWREIGEAMLNCPEELSGNPQSVQFRTIAEMEAL